MNHDNLEVYKIYIEDEAVEIRRATWDMALSATLHCLLGCGIGEVLGMAIGTWAGWHGAATVALAVTLAFIFGYALSMWALVWSGLALRAALKLALAADTLSIATMELVDNAVMVFIPGAMESGLGNLLFWASLAFALFVAFLAAWPVNYYLLRRNRGHALVHRHHQGHSQDR